MKQLKNCSPSLALLACILFIIMFTTYHAAAQHQQFPKQNNAEQIARGGTSASYTYKVFQAPNKMYGFDILKNGKFILHQPASNVPASNYHPALATKEYAEKAAQFCIEKIKKGQRPAMLTNNEIKQVIAQ